MPLDQSNRPTYCPSSDQPQCAYAPAASANLVWVSDLKASRKLLRSHVSRSTHARVRRNRTVEFQRMKIQHNQQDEDGKIYAQNDFQGSSPTCLPRVEDTTGDVDRHYRNISAGAPFENQANEYLTSLVSSPRRDRYIVFKNLSAPLPRFETFLLNYYIHAIVMNNPCDHWNAYRHAAMQDWFPVAIANPGMRMGILLCASKSLHARTGAPSYHQSALHYKAACLRILGDSVKDILRITDASSTFKVDDETISIALQLASDDFATGDSVAWESHINAVDQMVKLNGGLDSIKGMNGFLRRMVEALAFKHQQKTILTTRSDINDTLKLYSLEYFFCNFMSTESR
ncbi:hypothetical protein F4781DRAFT_26256 [Annulohypoxylon bovei var. microspora]|nr:hypothetical protein F4781DRAFT_26256 [Annulohypoxylon bovei var. microspora]